ncbi:MAG: hypothetical protein K9M97_00775 [Akkermansiaceae bacterium]|nr:hypothetical protein [Akkermansiaceae bacterium]
MVADLVKFNQGNFFQVLRDEDASGGFKYSLENQKSLDLGIFLNGLPIFTAEVKTDILSLNADFPLCHGTSRRFWISR